jgi:hypothetical protein
LEEYTYLPNQNKFIGLLPLQTVLKEKHSIFQEFQLQKLRWTNAIIVKIKQTNKYYEFEFLMFFGWYVSLWLKNKKEFLCMEMNCSNNLQHWEQMV